MMLTDLLSMSKQVPSKFFGLSLSVNMNEIKLQNKTKRKYNVYLLTEHEFSFVSKSITLLPEGLRRVSIFWFIKEYNCKAIQT